MTVSLDSPLSGGAGEGRQRLQRAAARAVGFIGKIARNPLTAIGGVIIFMLLVVVTMGMSNGFTVVTGQYYGAGDLDNMRRSAAMAGAMSRSRLAPRMRALCF